MSHDIAEKDGNGHSILDIRCGFAVPVSLDAAQTNHPLRPDTTMSAPQNNNGRTMSALTPICIVSARPRKSAKAILRVTPSRSLSSRKRKKAGTKVDMKPTARLFQPENNGGEGLSTSDLHSCHVPSPVIDQIIEWQRQRVATIRAINRINNATRSLVRRSLGWRMDLPEKDRNSINKHAVELIGEIQNGHSHNDTQVVVAGIVPYVLKDAASVIPQDAFRANIEKAMEKAAKSLPVWKWCEGVKGVGPKSLAMIVGEAGDLSKYANPAKLWKRLGLAPKDCYHDLTINGADCWKIPKARRSEIWNVGTCLIKAADAYKAIYDAEKARQESLHPELTKMHRHRRAQRYMEKRFIRDLWQAWNRAGGDLGTPDAQGLRVPARPYVEAQE